MNHQLYHLEPKHFSNNKEGKEKMRNQKVYCPKCKREIIFVIPLAPDSGRPCPTCGTPTKYIEYVGVE